MDYLGLYGLAIAFAISSLVNMLLLLLFLRIKFGDLMTVPSCDRFGVS